GACKPSLDIYSMVAQHTLPECGYSLSLTRLPRRNRMFNSKRKSQMQYGVLLAPLCVLLAASLPAKAQGAAPVQAPPQFIPTDVTPYTLNSERTRLNPNFKFKIFQMLPERLWFNMNTEVSQRLDTNVFMTSRDDKADYVFRALPNITLGYNVLKNTSIYSNYFVIKDVFANHTSLSFPTTQSLSWGVRHNLQVGDKNTLQFDFQARELWQTAHLNQFDFLPSVTFTRLQTPRDVFFGSALLQLRGAHYFAAPTRELDPFFTVGYIHRQGLWTFIVDNTY